MAAKKLHTDYPDLPPPEQPAQPGSLQKYLLTIVGFIIIFVCLFQSYNLVKMLRFHADAKNWSATPATILDAKLREHRGKNKTYSLHGSYQYEIAGKLYTAKRIQYSSDNDNIGDFHQVAYQELDYHRKSGEPLTVYVNPEDPQQAIVYRDLRKGVFWFDFFIATFIGIAGFTMFSVASHQRKEKEQEYLGAQANPSEPWRWRPLWKENTILCGSKNTLSQYSAGALIWNILAWPASYFVMKELQNNPEARFLNLFFVLPVFGLFLIYLWWKKREQFLNHGIASLSMDEMPARIGQELQATFRGLDNADEIQSLNITLTCTHKKEIQQGKHTRIIEKTIWGKKITKPVSSSSGGGQLIFPFNIAIPENLPATSWQDDVHNIEWHVTIRPTHKKRGHSMEFEVPVFN